MSEFNATALRVVEEAVYGVTPATPRFTEQRITDTTLDNSTRTIQNDELRTDLQKTGLVPVGEEAGGGWTGNLSFDSLHHPLRGVFGSAYAAHPTRRNNGVAGSAITDAVAGGTPGFNVAASAGTEYNSGVFTEKRIVFSRGWAQAANNGRQVLPAGATGTFIPWAGAVAESPAPATAEVFVVGVEFVADDIQALTAGSGLPARLFSLAAGGLASLGLLPGDQVKMGGALAANQFIVAPQNNDVAIVSQAQNTTIHFSEVPIGWATDAGVGRALWLFFPWRIVNGATKRTFTVEEEYADLAVPEWTYYRGVLFSRVGLRIPEGEKITTTVETQGATGTSVTTRLAGATTQAAPTGEVMNGATHVPSIRIDGVEQARTIVTEVEVNFAREAERRGAVGTYGAAGVRLGDFVASGRFDMYYTSNAVRVKAKAGTALSVSGFVGRPDQNTAHGWYVPRAQYTEAPRRNQNGSRTISPGWTASRDPSLGWTAAWFRYWYVEFTAQA